MPIPRRAFEAGQTDLEDVIWTFLRTNADLAFTSTEVAQELGALDFTLPIVEVETALNSLVRRGRAEAKPVREYGGSEAIYYAYARSFGLPIPPRG